MFLLLTILAARDETEKLCLSPSISKVTFAPVHTNTKLPSFSASMLMDSTPPVERHAGHPIPNSFSAA
jgi:hypothetical protein